MSNEDQTKTGNQTSKNMVTQTLSGTKSITLDPTAASISEQSLRELSNAEAIAHLKAYETTLEDSKKETIEFVIKMNSNKTVLSNDQLQKELLEREAEFNEMYTSRCEMIQVMKAILEAHPSYTGTICHTRNDDG